ncbi:von Willebrand factor C domain-containing protein 2-like [Mizuhopecten yessoensis]|uniref:von Willebrand factor C domain-containing protein 2-like n=1 Tax=Mizuhopecten yessoensis TaxID=6573 RepID=A0A210QP36_MIZYE|nr:von Willebrand factor C domain-containing protein 2-like [Mizuhopecten yessoensis]OWF50468.1 von Willebrand factor C domain-containing protein 2-like [Mizuhopecten yessoensis]
MDVNTMVFVVTCLSATSAFVLENRPVYPTPHITPPTCSKNGTIYNQGDGIPSDPCSTCSCQSGRISCIYQDCPYPDVGNQCVDPVSFASGCRRCPNGPNCRYGNLTIPYGLDVRVDEWKICRCSGGGEPTCRFSGCIYQKKFYSEGIFYPSPCERCQCDSYSNMVHCSLNKCTTEPLLCVDAIVEPGNCCHVCPNGPNCFAGNKKIPAGQDYNDGSQICRCPEPNPNLHFGSFGPQAVCKLVGPMAPPSTTNP